MSKENLRSLLERLGQEVGAANLELDAEGYCLVRIDDRIDLSIEIDEDSDSVILTAGCGDFPQEPSAALLLEMLDANFYWAGSGGATLSTNSETGVVYLQIREPLAQLELPRFQELILGLITNAEYWMSHLESAPRRTEETALPAELPRNVVAV